MSRALTPGLSLLCPGRFILSIFLTVLPQLLFIIIVFSYQLPGSRIGSVTRRPFFSVGAAPPAWWLASALLGGPPRGWLRGGWTVVLGCPRRAICAAARPAPPAGDGAAGGSRRAGAPLVGVRGAVYWPRLAGCCSTRYAGARPTVGC